MEKFFPLIAKVFFEILIKNKTYTVYGILETGPYKLLEEVCIKVTSNMDEKNCSVGENRPNYWLGDDIYMYLNQNGRTIATIEYGFLNFEHCVGAARDDEFQLQASNNDVVCIASLSVNDKQLLVQNNNDLPSFWNCVDNHMSTRRQTKKIPNINFS